MKNNRVAVRVEILKAARDRKTEKTLRYPKNSESVRLETPVAARTKNAMTSGRCKLSNQ